MLFLGWCFEECEKTRYRYEEGEKTRYRRSRLVKLNGPFCSSSVIFTRRGLERLPALLTPVYNSLDFMYRDKIQGGELEAYGIMPPIFYQDARWTSDVPGKRRGWGLGPIIQDGRRAGRDRMSAPVAPLCVEQGLAPRVAGMGRVWSLEELAEAAGASAALALGYERAVDAEEAAGVFSREFLVLPDYPLLDWAPRCPQDKVRASSQGQEGEEEQAGWQVEIGLMVDGMLLSPVLSLVVPHALPVSPRAAAGWLVLGLQVSY